MKNWFIDHYGPNNAILVLAGDINAAQAKPLVEKWFGSIKRGKQVAPVNAPVPTLEKDIKIVMKDKVPTTRIYRNWVVPGLADPDANALFIAMSALGGLSSSRLDNILVRQEQSVVGVSAYLIPFVHGSLVNIQADVKPGGDADAVAKRLDEILADYIKTGPTAEEVQRVAASNIAQQIDGLEQVGGFGGKAVALAEGELYVGDSSFYKKELERLASAKPETVKAAMQKWLTRPVLEIRVEPGEREAYKEVAAGSGSRTGTLTAPAFYAPPGADDVSVPAPMAFQDRSKFPEPTGTPALDFPTVEETTLSNGIKVFFARRAAVPTVRVAVSFNAGYAADPADKRGIASMMSTMLMEGTTSLTSTQIAETEEKLGADVNVGSSLDRTVASLRAVKPNLGLSLDLLADVIKNPAFAANELERVRVQQLTRIKSENNQPQGIAVRRLPPLLYGTGHPYGGPQTGSGYAETVATISRTDVSNFHQSWMHPSKAEIFVVGDTSLKEIKPMLEQRFGKWTPAAAPAPAKNFGVALPAPEAKIRLIDRPNSPQSLVLAGLVLDAKGSDDLLTLRAANEIFGGDFLSRINMDLRETKGWSYGVRSQINGAEDRVPFYMFAPVQTNQTGPSVKVLIDQLKDFNGDKPVTAAELEKTIKGNVLKLPGNYEQSSAVLGQMQADRLNKRPFNYAETLAGKYNGLTAAALNDAMRAKVDPSKVTWLIVGDAAKVKPQLEALGLPIEMVTEAANTSASNSAK
jgi:predicted Zn-dependent peptidase